MGMTARQKLAIACLLVLGAVLGGAILQLEPGGSASHTDEADSNGHATARPRSNEERATPVASADSSSTVESTAERRGTPHPAIALSDAQLRASGIELAESAPGQLERMLTLPGEIGLNEDRTAHIAPRVTGVVESVPARLGQRVRKGDVLAVIASPFISEQRSQLAAAQRRLELARTVLEREKRLWQEQISAEQDFLQAQTALQEADIAVNNFRQKLTALGATPDPRAGNRFELRAPFDATVLEKHITLGEVVKEDVNAFTLADLSTVWANFSVPAKDLAAVRVGKRSIVRAAALGAEVNGSITYVGTLIGAQTRMATARVVMDNPQEAWRPGLFVSVSIAADQHDAPVTVPIDAIQSLDGRPHVFVRVPGGFSPRAVELGASDGRRTEIKSGLAAGLKVAAAGSFMVRSELEKRSTDQPD